MKGTVRAINAFINIFSKHLGKAKYSCSSSFTLAVERKGAEYCILKYSIVYRMTQVMLECMATENISIHMPSCSFSLG